jgi:hypothetical protein
MTISSFSLPGMLEACNRLGHFCFFLPAERETELSSPKDISILHAVVSSLYPNVAKAEDVPDPRRPGVRL